jgi:hypothetical protein
LVRAAPSSAAGDHYELVWTRLSTGDTFTANLPLRMDALRTPTIRHNMVQRTRRSRTIRTHTRLCTNKDMGDPTPSPGSKTVAIKLNATDIQIPVFWQVGDLELGTYDCGPLVGYKVKGSVIPPKGATFSPIYNRQNHCSRNNNRRRQDNQHLPRRKARRPRITKKRRHTIHSHLGRKHT